MKFAFQPGAHSFVIVNADANCAVGEIVIDRKYRYRLVADGEFAGVVDELDDALPALITFIENNSNWKREGSTEYAKATLHGLLQVKLEDGHWYAYRHSSEPLMRGDNAVAFPTPEEAKRAAEAHLLDDPKLTKPTDDGLAWFV